MAGVIYLTWSAFPINSRNCLDYYARRTSCDPSSDYSWNYCLCNNGYNWINNVAVCLNREDPENLELVWSTMNSYCEQTLTPIVYSMDEFLAAAHAGNSAGSTLPVGPAAAPTGPTMSTPGAGGSGPETTAKPDSGGGGSSSGGSSSGSDLSTSDKIAIGVGVPVGFFSILGAIITWWMCCCRGR